MNEVHISVWGNKEACKEMASQKSASVFSPKRRLYSVSVLQPMAQGGRMSMSSVDHTVSATC